MAIAEKEIRPTDSDVPQAEGPDAMQDTWAMDSLFNQAQHDDNTLDQLCEETAVRESSKGSWVSQYPHIKVRGSILWWINAPAQPGQDESKQLVVPMTYWQQVLHQTHGHPWAGHQG